MFWLSSKTKLEGFFLDEKHPLIVDVDCEGMKESFFCVGDWFQFPIEESVFIFQVLLPVCKWVILPIGKDNSLKSLDKKQRKSWWKMRFWAWLNMNDVFRFDFLDLGDVNNNVPNKKDVD